MPRKKPAKPDAEIVPDDVTIDAKPVKEPVRKVVETKTITYEQTPDEIETEDSFDEDDFEIEEKPRRQKPNAKQEKQKLRERWSKKGIAPTGNLRVSIWKFTNEDDPMSGPQADKAFCNKFQTTAEAIDEGVHLEAAAKFGPGRYWLIIYLNNQIVDQWEFRVAAPSFGQMVSGQNPAMPVTIADPQNPGQVIVQMPAQQQAQADPFADFDKTLKMFERMEKMRQSLGLSPAAQNPEPQPAQLSPEQQLATVLLTDPDVKKKAVKSLLGSSGESGEKDTLSLVLEHIEPIGNALQGVIDRIFSNINQARFSNGQTQMAAQNVPAQSLPISTGWQNGQDASVQEFAEGASISQSNAQGQFESTQQPQVAPSVNPEDQLLILVLDHCKRRIPPKIAADHVLRYADQVEAQAPALSVYPFIELFLSTEPQSAMQIIESYNQDAKAVTALPHTAEWTRALQEELKQTYYTDGGETA